MEIFVENTSNNILAKKLKFNLEGVKKQSSRCKSTNKVHSCNIYALLRDEE